MRGGGELANGIYDFRFFLCKEEGLTTLLGIYPPSSKEAIEVTDGYLSTMPDFGMGVFNGDERWLEIDVGRFHQSIGDLTLGVPS